MIIHPWIPEYRYTCQQCGRTFITKVPQEMELSFRPVCSSACAFQKVLFYVQKMKLPEEYLRDMIKIIKINRDFSKFSYKTCEIQLSKYFSDLGLSNIMIIDLSAHLNEPVQKSEPSPAHLTGSFVPIWYNEPMSRVSQTGSSKAKMSQDLSQWQFPLSPQEMELKK